MVKCSEKKSMLENFRANVLIDVVAVVVVVAVVLLFFFSSFLLLLLPPMPINFCSEIQTNLQNVLRFLLKRKDVPKLSDQQRVVKDALVPFPLYNCVHVKTDVPAKEFGGKCSDL